MAKGICLLPIEGPNNSNTENAGKYKQIEEFLLFILQIFINFSVLAAILDAWGSGN